ncbi:DUF7344 domain-containing protein [Natrarchaeobius oligotrophus]|uniref:DUF7344 domain-containing protein n=1 Tax=Natrarchaeobius chitinivorans TaxID=1679083 RepID=A0A3N6N609_NATCH|nr:hypothetical protein [Natrarchaeobius chitinivorans]RQG93762.1 hypothetical protein EA472_22810 [Natrarchaeobius chitinivorans]
MMSTLTKYVGDLIQRPQPSPLTVDEASSAIENERRRLIVDVVSRIDDRITIRKLSEIVASAELEKPAGQLTSKERKRVYVALYQTHLPKLDDVDVIDYDQDRGVVEEGDAFGHALRILESVRAECDSNGGGGQ